VSDPWSVLRTGQRTLLRRQIESEAIYDGMLALELGGVEAAIKVLEQYALPYSRVLEQQRLDEGEVVS
jgi:hypothetical protein